MIQPKILQDVAIQNHYASRSVILGDESVPDVSHTDIFATTIKTYRSKEQMAGAV